MKITVEVGEMAPARTRGYPSLDCGKVAGQLGAGGWTEDEITDLVKGDPAGTAVDSTDGQIGGNGEPASAYGGEDGYVVVNYTTDKVVQVSDKLNRIGSG